VFFASSRPSATVAAGDGDSAAVGADGEWVVLHVGDVMMQNLLNDLG